MGSFLDEFLAIYNKRPIKVNNYGMQAPQLFLIYYFLKNFKPKTIIESGVAYGLGTYFFEQACPNASIHCLDPNHRDIMYKSSNALYYTNDFNEVDWSDIDKDSCLVFFDDHQNAFKRMQECKFIGFKHLVFEDNGPPGDGDCYSLNKIFSCSGNQIPKQSFFNFILNKFKSIRGQQTYKYFEYIPKNAFHKKYVLNNINACFEFPPVVDPGVKQPHKQPLFSDQSEKLKLFYDFCTNFSWMIYINLK